MSQKDVSLWLLKAISYFIYRELLWRQKKKKKCGKQRIICCIDFSIWVPGSSHAWNCVLLHHLSIAAWQITSKPSNLKQYIISHSSWESGTWEWFSCLSLAQDTSCGWVQWWVRLQVCLGLEDLLQTWLLAEGPSSLPNVFPQSCLNVLMTWYPEWVIPEWMTREREQVRSHSPKSHTVLPLYSIYWK